MQVKVRNGNVNKALSILKKKITEDGRLQEVRERMYYEKPSDRKHRNKKKAISREHKRVDV